MLEFETKGRPVAVQRFLACCAHHLCLRLHLTTMSGRTNYDPRRVCVNPFPDVHLGKDARSVGIYAAGALVRPLPSLLPRALTPGRAQFALANWAFLDAAILSAHAHGPADEPARDAPVHVAFVDWVPGLFSLLGMLVVNLIDKDRVKGEEGLGDSRAVWRARLFLFIGFAMMAGGLAGSVVRTLCPLYCDVVLTSGSVFSCSST
jgi:hypothetical protein